MNSSNLLAFILKINLWFIIQSTLVISKSKGSAETLRGIRSSTYQMCRIEENTKRTTKVHRWTCNLTPLVRNTCWKYCGKGEKFLFLSTIFCYLILDFSIKTRIRFSLRDKRLFKITEVEITRVDCSHTEPAFEKTVDTPGIRGVIVEYFFSCKTQVNNPQGSDEGFMQI